MSSRPLLPALAMLAVLTSGVVQAQVNRCVDEQGKISFSDTVCNGMTRAQKEFGVNASAKGWQVQDYRAVRVVQSGGGSSSATNARTTGLSTPPR